jgi:hypothetical protein
MEWDKFRSRHIHVITAVWDVTKVLFQSRHVLSSTGNIVLYSHEEAGSSTLN